MTTLVYIANEFPSAVEWYVGEEIRELRRRGFQVIPCSAKTVPATRVPTELQDLHEETISLRPLSPGTALATFVLCVIRMGDLGELWRRILLEGREAWPVRIRAIAHTFLGVSLAHRLRKAEIAHIHVHHGYYASWIAMVAARLLKVPFSLTLHGSDLLLHGVYLETKLRNCDFCLTVSEFNRRHILSHFPSIRASKILLQLLGVDVPDVMVSAAAGSSQQRPLTLLSVGRLHAVKNQAFLIQACFFLREYGVSLRCFFAGEGPDRRRLEFLIDELGLHDTVRLVGHVPRSELGPYYDEADLVVLTSRSEGIPIVLMEAMARGRLVLAPAITGIPELVLDGKTGFLYTPDALEELVWQVDRIRRALPDLSAIRQAAREHVRAHFHKQTNLRALGDLFLQRVASAPREEVYEDPVLQQI
jgi:glycosyltransferase involved in cell wall biosynthesis